MARGSHRDPTISIEANAATLEYQRPATPGLGLPAAPIALWSDLAGQSYGRRPL